VRAPCVGSAMIDTIVLVDSTTAPMKEILVNSRLFPVFGAGLSERLSSTHSNICLSSGRSRGHAPQRRAAVWTGASQSTICLSSSKVTVIEQPAISSDVT
jgi:hypothetical protein